jgi:hypothetical protein
MRGFPLHIDMFCCGISIDERHADVGGESATNQAEGVVESFAGPRLSTGTEFHYPQHSEHLFWTILSSEATTFLQFILPYRHM